MKKRAVFTACMVLAAIVSTADDVATVSRVFRLNHVSVSEASDAIQPLLTTRGSLTLQPQLSRVTVQDNPEVVARVAELLVEMDRPPGSYRIGIELLEGRSKPYPASQEIDVDARLKRMFKFASYRRLGRTVLEGDLGGSAQADLHEGYHVGFDSAAQEPTPQTPWGSADFGDRIELKNLTLEKIQAYSGGDSETVRLVRTSVFLFPKQEVLIGAVKSEQAETGLVLIVQALELEGN